MNHTSNISKLQELFELHKTGAITKEEYESLKSDIINQDEAQSMSNPKTNEIIITQSENQIELSAEGSKEKIKEDIGTQRQDELNIETTENKIPVIPITKPKRKLGSLIVIFFLLTGLVAAAILLYKYHNDYNKLIILNSQARSRIERLSADSLVKSDSISALYGRLIQNYSNYGSVVTNNNQIPLEGLIAYFPFNANANDESGNGHNATVVNAILTNDRFGNNNSAYSFDGNSGTERYIFSNIGTHNALSFSVWFKTATPTTMYPDILNYGSNNRLEASINGNHFAYTANGSIGKIAAGAVIGGTWAPLINSNVYVSDNQWHHAVICYVPNDNIYLYIDNIFVDKASYNQNNPTDDLLYIGRQINDNAGSVMHETHFNGSIDDIRIYDRKLTEMEISNLFNEKSK